MKDLITKSHQVHDKFIFETTADSQQNGSADGVGVRRDEIGENAVVKWGSVTQLLPYRPRRWRDLRDTLLPMSCHPRPHDVLVSRVVEINRHTRIEFDSGRKAKLYEGDVLCGAFGNRYATRQFFGKVPGLQSIYHILSQGGVFGQVISSPDGFSDPTLVQPLGYLANDDGEVVNLRQYAMESEKETPRVPIILVIGSSMDSGKTTTAVSVIRGLSTSGLTVNAGKLTGTACLKDLNLMFDAGAETVLDFNHVGFASTALISNDELRETCRTIITNLSAEGPDVLVLEIADGLIQRETRMVLDYLTEAALITDTCLAVHDVMAAPTCQEMLLEEWGLHVTAVSGAVTASPLSTEELRSMVSAPCLTADELSGTSVVTLFRNSLPDAVRETSLTA